MCKHRGNNSRGPVVVRPLAARRDPTRLWLVPDSGYKLPSRACGGSYSQVRVNPDQQPCALYHGQWHPHILSKIVSAVTQRLAGPYNREAHGTSRSSAGCSGLESRRHDRTSGNIFSLIRCAGTSGFITLSTAAALLAEAISTQADL